MGKEEKAAKNIFWVVNKLCSNSLLVKMHKNFWGKTWTSNDIIAEIEREWFMIEYKYK